MILNKSRISISLPFYHLTHMNIVLEEFARDCWLAPESCAGMMKLTSLDMAHKDVPAYPLHFDIFVVGFDFWRTHEFGNAPYPRQRTPRKVPSISFVQIATHPIGSYNSSETVTWNCVISCRLSQSHAVTYSSSWNCTCYPHKTLVCYKLHIWQSIHMRTHN